MKFRDFLNEVKYNEKFIFKTEKGTKIKVRYTAEDGNIEFKFFNPETKKDSDEIRIQYSGKHSPYYKGKETPEESAISNWLLGTSVKDM